MSNSAWPILLTLPLFFLVWLIADFWITRKWFKETEARINQIFDGLKTFLFVTLIDRISSAFEDDQTGEEDSDDPTE